MANRIIDVATDKQNSVQTMCQCTKNYNLDISISIYHIVSVYNTVSSTLSTTTKKRINYTYLNQYFWRKCNFCQDYIYYALFCLTFSVHCLIFKFTGELFRVRLQTALKDVSVRNSQAGGHKAVAAHLDRQSQGL